MQVYTTEICVKTHIIDALRYFHIFRFPLFIGELQKYLGTRITIEELKVVLHELVASRELFVYKDLYMLENDRSLADARLKSIKKAAIRMKEAYRSGAIISRFPFVKAVCISGSLSKGYADDRSDIDFFIITEKNRLWICRSLLHIFKKFTFLNNTQHSYCMNYFLDESKPCLEEQNRFTGTEIVTLIPLYDEGVFASFIEANNNWVEPLFPNFTSVKPIPNFKVFIKKLAESFLELLAPRALNQALMSLTDTWWRYKWQRKNYPMEDYDLAMKTRWFVSKNHPANYQKKVLHQLKLQFNA
ncbi:nucleotidyltransferase domain-containing protein [Polluticoccus soli]|uniref:nucleotidyltransferase domain-containing protein n=1 Tax=Polluticoccus soli TaxID=3034150 RepID=UPI0023E162C5|nr:nucleotidyltransferase domain-containing protein [Flavipsychrobacter sp. JY13-12]